MARIVMKHSSERKPKIETDQERHMRVLRQMLDRDGLDYEVSESGDILTSYDDGEPEPPVMPEVSGETQVSDVTAQADKLMAKVLRGESENAATIIEEAGLDSSKFVNFGPEEWATEAERQFSKAAKSESIGEASAVSSPGGDATPSGTDQELLNEIDTLQKHPVANAAKIKELWAQGRQRGILR